MLTHIIDFSVRNKGGVIAFYVICSIAAWMLLRKINVDAIPDLTDTQVIIYTPWERPPDIIEDQLTYPLVTSLTVAPKVKSVRGFSDNGLSLVYVIFEDGTDIYWARARVSEYLSGIQRQLPDGVVPGLGPDASGVGWVFQYAIVDRTGKRDISEIRTLQDYKIKLLLNSIEGVSEVATIGGFDKRFIISVNPLRLSESGISLETVIKKIKESNIETGGGVIEISGREIMIVGRGYIKTAEDIRQIPIARTAEGTPVTLQNIAEVKFGPGPRRGAGDLNGFGETVSGIIVMRHGENAVSVIGRVKAEIENIKKILPAGMEIVTVYDRSELIEDTISNLREKLIEEIIIVIIVIAIFLWHWPSALVPVLTIPIAVLLSFIPFYFLDISANIMSLGGIIISIGVLVDGAIVEVENAYRRIEEWERKGRVEDIYTVRLNALKEVAPHVFFSLLIIGVSFTPVFILTGQEGRLFKPLAISKNLTMFVAALLAVSFDPALRMMFTRVEPFVFKGLPARLKLDAVANTVFIGKYRPEESHPVTRILMRFYTPVCKFSLNHPKKMVGGAISAILLTVPLYLSLGKEFMPPLWEGSILYMPTTLPGLSMPQAVKILQDMDKKIYAFPEVESVYGKAGRADTATDPAPVSMFETIIQLRPKKYWREADTFYKDWPPFVKNFLSRFIDNKISKEQLIELLNKEISYPGFTNAWTMPIRTRIDMLSTGIRTPIGIKIRGDSHTEIEQLGKEIEKVLKNTEGVRSVFAERVAASAYLNVKWNRTALARHGISIESAQRTLEYGVGGKVITETINGRDRYGIALRFPPDFRNSPKSIGSLFVDAGEGRSIPVSQLAEIKIEEGPGMIRNENGFLTGYIYIDTNGKDLAGIIEQIKRKVDSQVVKRTGYPLEYSGQYENIQSQNESLKLILPVVILTIIILLYWNTGSKFRTLLILSAVPFSSIGAFLLLWVLDYQISMAVWVGLIALLGLDAEMGVFMTMYLEMSIRDFSQNRDITQPAVLKSAILNGSIQRLRPKVMTVITAMLGLMPVLFSQGPGADMMKRIAAPVFGGLVTSFILELLIYPPIYYIYYHGRGKRK